MSGPIAFRFNDEDVEAEYQQYRDSLDGDPSKSDVARELIDAGLAARHRDVYDHVGADEELRETVKEARNVEETDAEAIRRLLRKGIDASRNKPDTRRERAANAVVVATLGAVGGIGYHLEGVAGAAVAVLGVTLLITFADVFVGAVLGLVERLDTAGDVRARLEGAREERPDVEERDREGATEEEPA
jgi:predicted anti-sigma-YlaC factor YlaD